MFEPSATQTLRPYECLAPPPAETQLWSRLPAWLARRRAALLDTRRTRQAIQDLHAMDARGLRDVGLTRGMIVFAVRGLTRDDVRGRSPAA